MVDAALAVPAFMLTPTLSQIKPPHDALTNNPQPTISYTYDAACNSPDCGLTPDYFAGYSLSATLNQQPISPFVFDRGTGQAGYTPATRLPEGSNTLSAQVKDGFGHSSPIINDLFTIDTIPPGFLSISPADGSVVTTAQVNLQGTVDDIGASVVLEGVGPATDANTEGGILHFAMPVTLKAGANSLTVTAVDKAGNSTSQTMHLTYQPEALLSLSVLSPASGAAVGDATVLVSGAFQGPANTGITVNGVVAAQDGNRFYAQVPLQPGANTLTVTATTQDGASATQTVSVVSDGASPLQISAAPVSGVAPFNADFSVQNNTANAIAIASIEADFNGDGVSDFSTTDPAAPLQFTYAVPGVYQARFKITDSQGNVAEKVVAVVVQDPAQLDQLLRAQWGGMTSALIAGDKAHALNLFECAGTGKIWSSF